MTWQPYDPCPGGCGVIGWKLKRNGHVVGCTCPGDRQRDSQRKGALGEGRRHARLSSRRAAPKDESAYAYDIRVSTQDKVGRQTPRLFWQVLQSRFITQAFKQSRDKIPIGSQTFPAVYLEMDPEHAFLLVDVSGGKLAL